MARLLVNPGSPGAWEIQLKPGPNFLGRGFANDFKIDDPSVSGAHCQIVVDSGNILIKDLGSTNGTFVNRAPVREAAIQPGQTIHLGGVEILFENEATATPVQSAAAPVARAIPHAPPGLSIRATNRTESGPTAMVIPPPVPPGTEQEPPMPPPLTPAPTTAQPATGSRNCKFHAKTPGRYYCPKCVQYFCELCVASRAVAGAQKKFCRHCGTETKAIQIQITRPTTKGFFARLPGVLIYPFKGSGVLILIAATILFAVLDVVSGGISILAKIIAVGYFFSFMQNIVHSTAAGDEEMADLPGMDGLFGACFTLAATVALSFGIPIGLAVAKFFFDVEIPMSGILVITGLCCLYFPMAFLAVAMKDSVMAANPLIVFPAMFKAPIEYLVTALLLTGVFGFRVLGNSLAFFAQAEGHATRDMSVLFITFGYRAFWSFASIYLLTVGMRILGLLYVTKKEKFGWFRH
jgi:hypothetical protein